MGDPRQWPRLGVDLPQIHGPTPGHADAVREFAVRAEELGFDACWVHEGALGPVPSLEPVTLLGFVAAVTGRVRLGTSVVLASLRQPLPLARAMATVDRLSQGRLIAGLALGPRSAAGVYGTGDERPGERFSELVDLLRAAWGDDPVAHRGRRWSVTDVSVQPKPWQRPGPPLWLGGRSRGALRRAAALGDGWIGSGVSSIEEFAHDVEELRGLLDDAGRPVGGLAIARRCYVVLGDDLNAARDRHWAWFQAVYGDGDLGDRALFVGRVAELRAAIDELGQAGATDLILSFLERPGEHLEKLSQLL
ncbi:MAG: LLM class flavin-dependent oxidoreductase [Acidimicrobiia bacterium]|nr:LLM class flavin-dependent oxidoreductase [Acidimicrobiia bacterium]